LVDCFFENLVGLEITDHHMLNLNQLSTLSSKVISENGCEIW